MAMKRARMIAGFILCAVLLATYPMSALGAKVDFTRKGNLNVQLEVTTNHDWSGVVFSIYRIGDVDNTNGGMRYVLSGAFADAGVSLDYMTSQEAEDAADALHNFVEEKHIAPLATGAVNAAGKVAFTDLPVGVYFGQMTDGPDNVLVTPFIVSIPYYKDGSLTYMVPVYPKAEVLEPTPTPTPTATPTPVPYTTTPGDLPQTGVVRWPVLALSVGSALFIVLGVFALLAARKKKANRK
jgi:hypothetical protein